jgi:hypothetical protein
MKRLLLGAALLGAMAVPTAASAAPADQAQCRQTVKDLAVAASEEGTYGDFVSDTIYGNEPNIVGPFSPGGPEEQEPGTQAGRVVPSASPGPESIAGGSFTMGEFQALVRAACA